MLCGPIFIMSCWVVGNTAITRPRRRRFRFAGYTAAIPDFDGLFMIPGDETAVGGANTHLLDEIRTYDSSANAAIAHATRRDVWTGKPHSSDQNLSGRAGLYRTLITSPTERL